MSAEGLTGQRWKLHVVIHGTNIRDTATDLVLFRVTRQATEAEMRLATSAPQLAEALLECVEMFRRLGLDTPSMPGFEKTTPEKARAALLEAGVLP